LKIRDHLHYFLMGMSRVLDIGGTLSRRTCVLSDEEAKQADIDALTSDWEAVGNDMKTVLGVKKAE
jgi:hypothetical protein